MKFLFILAVSLYAESKDQAALRLAAEQHARDQAQIAKVTADLAASAASKAEMLRSIAQLNTNNQKRANEKASISADSHVADSQALLDAAELQNDRAIFAAGRLAENTSRSFYEMLGAVISTFIGSLFTMLGIILSHHFAMAKIDEVGKSAEAAYREANTVNNKIKEIGLQMSDGRPLNPTAER